MGKIYCTECGTELDDSVKFCSSCGTPVDNKNIILKSNEVNENKDNSNKGINVKEISKKANKSNFSAASKVFLGVAAILVICVLIVVAYVGFSMMSVNDADISEDTTETLSPSFTDTVYGINFQIPEGYETFSGKDNQNKGTMITYDRSYMGSDGNIIEIAVSTTQGSFYWDLTQNRDYNDVDKTINGHSGVLKSSGVFSYVTGDKLVVITGADEQQLENIIIE